MILVAGSTGYLGSEICRRLTMGGARVRGMIRGTSDAGTVNALRSFGVETTIADVRDRASLDAACRNVDTVISTVTTTRSRQDGDSIEATDGSGQLALIDAARQAGVERFVLISYTRNIDDDSPLTRAKRAAEARVIESGMEYTILRPSYFMEAWLSPALGFDFPNRRATIYGDGSRAISFISLRDVAESAVRSLRCDDAVNAAIELGGPEALSPAAIVRLFEELSGSSFEVQQMPEAALEAGVAGATDSLQCSFSALMLAYARGDEVRSELQPRLAVPLTSVRDYARQALAVPSAANPIATSPP
ncbi:MAG TPA: SDR family oxidoreductase [Gemmatimonadaceae bacterium]|nr:SDR family oxidoreductase [Gemmatimonadaceae bacterium]